MATHTQPPSVPRWMTIVYWLTTGFFSLFMGFAAVNYFMQNPDIVATITGLGYPMYFLYILGTAKALGVLALLYPGFPRVKEWAYAGFTFNLLSASISHLAAGEPFYTAIPPLVFLFILAISYVLWHRRLRT